MALYTVGESRLQIKQPVFKPWLHLYSTLVTWGQLPNCWYFISSPVCCYSVTPSCPPPFDPLDCSMPGFPVLHHLPELAQTHVHRVSHAMKPSHPRSSPSPPFFSLSQHHGLLKWVTSSHRVVKVLELQHQPFQWIQDWSPLGWTGWISLQSKGLSRVFFHTTVQKHQFFYAQPSLWSNSHMTTGKTIALTRRTFVGKVMSLLFNMLSRLVIAFLPRSKSLFISWLQSPSATSPVKSLLINIISLGCFGGYRWNTLFLYQSMVPGKKQQ